MAKSVELGTILGIDLGTTSVKVSIISDECYGNVTAVSQTTDATIPCQFSPGVGNVQDPIQIIRAIETCLENFGKNVLSSVRGIGVTGQMHGCVLWKGKSLVISENIIIKTGDAILSPLYTWQDGRCDTEFLNSLPQQQTHNRLATGHGCATLFWLQRHHPEFISQFDRAGTVMDLLVNVLCGSDEVVMSVQNAASWSYYDCQSKRWNEYLLNQSGFPVHLLPTVLDAGMIAGSLHSSWMGIPPGTKVSVGLGDCQSFVFSALNSLKDAVINIGTSAQLVTLMPSDFSPPPASPASSIEYFPYFKDKYIAVAAALNGGNVLSLFVDTLSEWALQLGLTSGQDKDALFQRLVQLGSSSQEPTLVIDPVLLGERHKMDSRGSITNITMDNLDLGSFFRSLCKGLISNLESMVPKTKLCNDGIEQIVGVGNALLKNVVLQQEIERIFALPVVYREDCDASLGAALVMKSALEEES